MKKEFESYRKAISWIALHAISQFHLDVLKEELFSNHENTGSYYIHTIIMN